MKKSEFKNLFAAYRRAQKTVAGSHDCYAQEWAGSVGWKPTTTSDVLTARQKGYSFARTANRHGQYGWEAAGFGL